MGEVSEAQDSVLIPSNRDVFIYLYSHPSTGDPVYVGKTFSVEERKKQHLYEAKTGNRKTKFYSWLKKHIEAEPVIVEVCDLLNWEERERHWISYCRSINQNLLNIMDGGGGFNYLTCDSEYKKLLSDAAKAKFKEKPCLKERYVELYGKLNKEQLVGVFIDYHEMNVSTCRLSQKYNISQSSITEILNGKSYKHLTESLLQKYGKPGIRVSTRDKSNIVEAVCCNYLEGFTINELVSKYKCHRVTIFSYIKIGTGKTFQKHEKDKLRDKILSAYNSGGTSRREIAEAIGCDFTQVCKVINKQKTRYGEN